ncbi:Minor tail protein U [Enterobacter sp. FY-07]|uniref:phage minor tail U family protein n=1 Tax=Kosakonia oryzendophytica TaxID=1005665 RepID=UPI0007771256|nr:phage minor tail U family protein [Kosakonia oryzendophytica]AMO48888.1 Minor tail protein U [Enterobacter sp. FY-07]WBT56607.1 phage minor tail U family protein [Kosakonia oryzendophytica]
MIHTHIRAAVLAALENNIASKTIWFDGRPAFLSPDDLPAVAVYLTDAECTEDSLDEDMWSAVLHIEVFLKATETDSALDAWVEEKIYPVMKNIVALDSLVETLSPSGYDYQRDDEATTWGSADLKYSITYQM